MYGAGLSRPARTVLLAKNRYGHPVGGSGTPENVRGHRLRTTIIVGILRDQFHVLVPPGKAFEVPALDSVGNTFLLLLCSGDGGLHDDL